MPVTIDYAAGFLRNFTTTNDLARSRMIFAPTGGG
jgi:hypothetical protein